jgi:formylglycine-generating enzyme required for sulfatase activity
MVLKWVPAGTFQMGSRKSEVGRQNDEGPQTQVTFTEGFWMGETEVTQAQWEAVMGNNPSNFKGANLPVEMISWNDAMAFCERLSQRTGQQISLPTEARWEYACRGGMTTAFSFGVTISTDQANYDGKHPYGSGQQGVFRDRTTSVKLFDPNEWGLYGMHGNVWEWCEDWYGPYPGGSKTNYTGPASGDRRVFRGGSWYMGPERLRSAHRHWFARHDRYTSMGFRVCASSASPG